MRCGSAKSPVRLCAESTMRWVHRWAAGGADVKDIREAVDSLPGQVKAYVVDAKGDTLYSTDPQVKNVNITDREYFSALARGELLLPFRTYDKPA